MFSTGLLIFLESSDYSSAIVDGEECCLVGEIVDHPVTNDANNDCSEPFEDTGKSQ